MEKNKKQKQKINIEGSTKAIDNQVRSRKICWNNPIKKENTRKWWKKNNKWMKYVQFFYSFRSFYEV